MSYNDWENAQIDEQAAAQEAGDYPAPDGPLYGDWGPGVEDDAMADQWYAETVGVTLTVKVGKWKEGSVRTDKLCPECGGALFEKSGAPYPYWCAGCDALLTASELETGRLQPF